MKFNSHQGYIPTATYGSFVRGKHDIVSDELAKDILDAVDDCTIEHLRTYGKQRSLRTSVDTGTNTLSVVFGCPFTGTAILEICEFRVPLSLIAVKPEGTREAFICGEIEKLIQLGERVIAKKFGLK